MPTPTTTAKPRKTRRRAHSRLSGAVFGASATVLVLLGAATVPDNPRQLSDFTEALAAAEVFDGSSVSDTGTDGDLHAVAPAPRRHIEPGPSLTFDVPA